jgi:hypothetical protein
VAVDEQRVTREAPRTSWFASVASVFPLRAVIAPWLLSRVISITVLLISMHDPSRGSRFTQLTLQWDGAYYLDIARHGYGAVHPPGALQAKWPFFPGLPALIRVLSEVGRDNVMIFIVNQLVFLVALAGVYCIDRRPASRRASALTVWALALFPASFVFSMTYASSIFLAASVWAFVCVETRHDLLAGLLAAAAAIVRPNGVVVTIVLVVAVWAWRRAVLVVLPTVVVLGAWLWYCYDRTGDALVFLSTKSQWEEITLWNVVNLQGKLTAVPHVLLAAAAITAVVLRRRKLPVSWLLYTGLYLFPSLITGMVGLGRYANECFPPFVAAGELLERVSVRLQRAALALSTVGLVVFAYVIGHYQVVP